MNRTPKTNDLFNFFNKNFEGIFNAFFINLSVNIIATGLVKTVLCINYSYTIILLIQTQTCITKGADVYYSVTAHAC